MEQCFVDSNRILVRYAEEGGKDKEGIIEIRKGLNDITIGDKKYAQVRIPIEPGWCIEGVALYSDDIPDNYDIVYYTKKPKGTPLKTDPKHHSEAVFKYNPNDTYYAFKILNSNYNVLWCSEQLHNATISPSYMSNIMEAELNLRIAIKKASTMEHKSDTDLTDMCQAHIRCLSIIDHWNKKGE